MIWRKYLIMMFNCCLFGKDSVVERFVLLSHLYVIVVLANVVDAFLLKLWYAFGVECQ